MRVARKIMRVAPSIGKLIRPESIVQVGNMARIDNGKYGIKYVEMKKLSPRLRKLIA